MLAGGTGIHTLGPPPRAFDLMSVRVCVCGQFKRYRMIKIDSRMMVVLALALASIFSTVMVEVSGVKQLECKKQMAGC